MYFFGSLSIFVALQAACFLFWNFYTDFLIFGPQVQYDFGERGFGNPSSYSFLGDLMTALGLHWRHAHQWRMHMMLFAALCAVILALAWKNGRSIRSLSGLEPFDQDRLLVVLAILTYVLISPRFMAYSQMVMIAPAYLIAKRLFTKPEGVFLFLGMMALQSRGYGALPGMNGILEFFWNFYELTLAAILWIFIIHSISSSRRRGKILGFWRSAEPLESATKGS